VNKYFPHKFKLDTTQWRLSCFGLFYLPRYPSGTNWIRGSSCFEESKDV